MRFVVDASVAVKWLVVEEDADVAQELATSGEELHAPRLMPPRSPMRCGARPGRVR